MLYQSKNEFNADDLFLENTGPRKLVKLVCCRTCARARQSGRKHTDALAHVKTEASAAVLESGRSTL